MARARNIKPGFFINDDLGRIEPLGRILFAGLWTIADREGRLEDRPAKIKIQTVPYDDCDVDTLLDALDAAGFIQRYEVGGSRYIQVVNWKKHQNPHIKEAASEIPAPEKHQISTGQAQEKHSTSPADSLNPHPSSFNLITSSSEVSAEEAEEPKPKKEFAEGSPELALAEKLQAFILGNNPNARTPTSLQKWAGDFDRMIRLDKRPIPEIEAVMEFSQRDSFWRSNILSAGKLREKYDQLYLKGKAKRASPGVTGDYMKRRLAMAMAADQAREGES